MARVDVRAEVTGAIWKVCKAVNEKVAEGDPIVIVESMKMEIPVLAECEGSIVELRVSEGQAVNEGDVIAVVEGE